MIACHYLIQDQQQTNQRLVGYIEVVKLFLGGMITDQLANDQLETSYHLKLDYPAQFQRTCLCLNI